MGEEKQLFIEEEIEQKLKIMKVVEDTLNKRKAEAVFCFSFFLAAVCVWVFLVELWNMVGRPIEPRHMTYGVEIIAIVMFVVTVLKTSIKIQNMGLTRKNLKRALKRGALISLIIVVLMVAAKLIMKPGEPIFDWAKFMPIYVLTSILQEFLARGFLLSCLMNIYDLETRKKEHVSVILSSLLFTTLHLYYGCLFMVGAGVLSVLLGYVYLKDKNIWGVSLIHFVFGTVGVMLSLV